MLKLRVRKKDLARGAEMISAVLLLFAGVLSIVAPGGIRSHIAFVFGMVMAVYGILSIIMYLLMRSSPFNAECFFTDGITVLAFCGQVGKEELIPFSMGAWLLFSGITRLVLTLSLRREKANCWWMVALSGLVLLILGMVSQYCFAATSGLNGLFEGLAFLFEGAACLFLWWIWRELPGNGEEKES